MGIFGVIEKILWQLTDLMKTCLWQKMQISKRLKEWGKRNNKKFGTIKME